MRPAAARRACAVLAAALALVAAGCGRRTQVEYHGGDSLGVGVDSSVVAVREAQEAWDQEGGEQAARLSAQALLIALGQRPPDAWAARAEAFLDSLGVGAEVADGDCVLAVNFFSRADPGAGSWPWLFWCGARGTESQAIDGRSMHLLRVASRGISAGPPRRDAPPPAVAALFDQRAALGTQPLLMVWTRVGGRWEIAQTLGPDSLGGAGTGEFESHGDSLLLVTRTYRASRGFNECPTCPHVFRTRRFAWGMLGFTRLDEEEAPSPYSTFVRFIQALGVDDREAQEAMVTDPSIAEEARRAGLGRPQGAWRVAPATDETASSMVFLRGASEAYRVGFETRGGAWLISSIEPADRGDE